MARPTNVAPLTARAAVARKPSQRRSQERVQALLNAADQLLAEREITDIGLYDVARVANIPPGSVYHFFPTKESVFLALAERYLTELRTHVEEKLDASKIEGWQDLIALRYHRVVEFFNARVAARKLSLGTNVGTDIKDQDVKDIQTTASRSYDYLDRYFHMPYIKNPEMKFTVLIGIYDGVWMASYARHGYITEEFAREGLAAGLAYCETFLPKVIPLRTPEEKA
jgi:AcrR family transcriptional regulator